MQAAPSDALYDLIVVGGGPHALSILARIFEERPGSLYTDVESSRLSFLRKYQKQPKQALPSAKDLRVLAIDKSGHQWMAQWNKNFKFLDIKHLRSPMFFHPDPSDLDALLAFSQEKGCDCDDIEITGVIGKEKSKHKLKKKGKGQSIRTDFNERDRQDYFNPSSKTFREFCERVVDRYHLGNSIIKGEVIDIDYAPIHEVGVGLLEPHFCLTLAGKSDKLFSRALVLAPGVAQLPNLPSYLDSSLRLESWCHSSDLARLPAFPPPNLPPSCRSTIVVIGGGLTSAQIVDLLIRKGVQKVYLITRSHLKSKHFDLDLEWLGKYGNIKKMQFYQSDFDERAGQVFGARNGGSIPPRYIKLLKTYEKQGKLEIMTETQVTDSTYDSKTKSWSLSCVKKKPPIPSLPVSRTRSRSSTSDSTEDSPFITAEAVTPEPNEEFTTRSLNSIDYLVSATGSRPDFSALSFLSTILEKYPVNCTAGLPHLSEDLQFDGFPELPLFVGSGFAALQIGPGSFNLIGGREIAERIAARLGVLEMLRSDLDQELRDEEVENVKKDRKTVGGGSHGLFGIAGNEGNYFSALGAGSLAVES